MYGRVVNCSCAHKVIANLYTAKSDNSAQMTTPSASPPPLFPLLSRIPYPYPSVGFEAVELAEAEPPWPAVHPVATNVEVRTKVAAADVLGVEERHIACEK